MYIISLKRKKYQHEAILAEKWHLEGFSAILVCKDSGQ